MEILMNCTKKNIAIVFTSVLMVLLQAPECHGVTLRPLVHRFADGIKYIIKAPFILTARSIKAAPATLFRCAKRHPYISLAAITSTLLATAGITYCCRRYGIKTTLNAPVNFSKQRIHDLKMTFWPPENSDDPYVLSSKINKLRPKIDDLWFEAQWEIHDREILRIFYDEKNKFYVKLCRLETAQDLKQILQHLQTASDTINHLKQVRKLKTLKNESFLLWQDAKNNIYSQFPFTDEQKRINSIFDKHLKIFNDRTDQIDSSGSIEQAINHLRNAQQTINKIMSIIDAFKLWSYQSSFHDYIRKQSLWQNTSNQLKLHGQIIVTKFEDAYKKYEERIENLLIERNFKKLARYVQMTQAVINSALGDLQPLIEQEQLKQRLQKMVQQAECSSKKAWDLASFQLARKHMPHQWLNQYRTRFEEESRHIKTTGTTQQLIQFLNATAAHIRTAQLFNQYNTQMTSFDSIKQILPEQSLLDFDILYKQHSPDKLLEQFGQPNFIDTIEQVSQEFNRKLEQCKIKELTEAHHNAKLIWESNQSSLNSPLIHHESIRIPTKSRKLLQLKEQNFYISIKNAIENSGPGQALLLLKDIETHVDTLSASSELRELIRQDNASINEFNEQETELFKAWQKKNEIVLRKNLPDTCKHYQDCQKRIKQQLEDSLRQGKISEALDMLRKAHAIV